MTFAGYQATDVIDEQLADPTPARLRQADADLEAFYERPFNFPFGAVAPELWARLGPTPLTAVVDATPLTGRFPLVVGVGGAQGNAVLGEFLASHGYVVALVGSPAFPDMSQVARMEWYVRDLEFALARMRELPLVDGDRVATWGFSFAGMPALLAGMRAPGIDAVVSLESAIFYQPFMQQLTGNPFYDVASLRVPFLHMMREEESRPNEQLDRFEALRYSERVRYLLTDTTLVHQDFGTHGIAAAAVLGKRPGALAAARRAQVANAEYVRHFLDAHVKGSASAAAWLARPPEANGFAAGDVTIVRLPARTPAPSAREFVATARASGIQRALEQFHSARRADPEAPLFREATINGLGYQLLRGARPVDAIELFKVNVELFPRSANVHDSLAEAYEVTGDSTRAVQIARKTLEVVSTDTTLNENARENFRRVANDRIRRLERP
jgi:dienelactone hydrolase